MRDSAVARWLTAAAAAALTACATPAQKPPSAVAAAAPAPQELDPSYDWHALEVAGFGTLLKDVPVKLHEVLLFRDEARDPAADECECYAIDGSAPRFMAMTPDQYTLCFEQDRLVRVLATVILPADRAAKEFAAACGLWLKNAGAPTAVVNPLPVASSTPPRDCDGSDGTTAFSARLDDAGGESAAGAAMALTIKLDSVPNP